MRYGYKNGAKHCPVPVKPWKSTQHKANEFSNYVYMNPFPSENDDNTQKKSGKSDFREMSVNKQESKQFCSVSAQKKEFSSYPYVAFEYDTGNQSKKVI